MQLVNVFDDAEMEEGPGRDGFWFRGAELGARLAAARIGAGLYEAREDVPIWPYHFHYPGEEWLYVLEGAPVLRDGAGRRALEAGDVVCFPPGHRGAHTVEGPGRFIIFSAAESSGPYVAVYPDSDKVSVFPGVDFAPINHMLLPRSGSVDYWHGEGDGPVPSAPVTREPDVIPGPPVVNVGHPAFEPGPGLRSAPLGGPLGAARLDGAVVGLEPGADLGPYHYEHGRELWLLVLAGTPMVQHSDGAGALSPGDLACLPEGPAGGRRVLNPSPDPARVLLLWTTGFPAATCYPETGEWVLRPGPDADELHLHRGPVRSAAPGRASGA